MTDLASNSSSDSAFSPTVSSPFLAVDPLELGKDTVGVLNSGSQMMPVIPELSGVGMGTLLGDQYSTVQVSQSEGGSQAVLQALANEIAPIYPQVAKAMTAPTLDSALQSGVGLFSRGSQLIESSVASGKGMASETASDVGSSVRELVEGALARWQADDNALRTGLNQQAEELVDDLKSLAAEVDDSEWMDRGKRRLSVARARVEGVADKVFTSLGYVGGAATREDETAIAHAMQRLQRTLVDFRNSSEFAPTLKTAFGDHWQTPEAEALVDDLIAGANGPAIEIVDAQRLLGDGAFGDNTIFIADEVVAEAAENAEALDDVLLEEVGHYFDQALNTVDAAGDEGEIFARLVQGEDISTAEMQTLKSENDHSTLTFNGTTISVENRRFLGGSANHAFTAPPKPVTKPVMTPVTPVDKLIQPTPVIGSDRRLYLQAGTVDRFDEAMAKQRQRSAPTPVAQPVQPVQPVSGNGTVEVQAGDTLSAIASQHGIQWTDLRKPDGTAFTESEARGLQIGADVVLPSQPAPASVTPPPAVVPASPAAVRQKVTQLQDDAEVLATASPYAAQAIQQEAQALIEEEEQRATEAERVAAAEKQQAAKERREKIAQLTADAEVLATASPAAADAMNTEAQVLIDQTPAPDPQELKKNAELIATASPAAADAMNQQAETLIEKAEEEKTEQLFNDSALIATASPAAADAMHAEAVERVADKTANEESLSEIEQLQNDAERLATASPYAAQVMQAESETLSIGEKIQTLQTDAELLATASPYASQAMHQEAKTLIPQLVTSALSRSDLSVEAAAPDDRKFNEVRGDQSNIRGWDLSTADDSDALHFYIGEDGEGSWVVGSGLIDYEASDEDAVLSSFEILTVDARGNLDNSIEQGDFWGAELGGQVLEVELKPWGQTVDVGLYNVDANVGGDSDGYGVMMTASFADVNYSNGAPSPENNNDIQIAGGLSYGGGGGFNFVFSDPDGDGIMNFGFDAAAGPVTIRPRSEYIGRELAEVPGEVIESKNFVERLFSRGWFGLG
ncbi:MAG: LysM domain-containing protein [Cyanobacteria bacterium P01_A01_bin.116]